MFCYHLKIIFYLKTYLKVIYLKTIFCGNFFLSDYFLLLMVNIDSIRRKQYYKEEIIA